MIKRVLLIVPPDNDAKNFSYETCKLGRYPNFPPYGFGVLATHLRGDGIEVDVLNLNSSILKGCMATKKEEDFNYETILDDTLVWRLDSFKPDIVGVTCMFSQTHKSTKDVCSLVNAWDSKIPLALGGVHPTNSMKEPTTREQFMKDFHMVDHFFPYESELDFRDFVIGINDEIHHKVPAHDDLNVIPAHDLITEPDLAENGKIGSFHMYPKEGAKFSTVLANRGCRARCTFCSVRNFNGLSVRSRSIQSVIDELLLLKDKHGVDHVMWLDDDFLHDGKRAMKLFDEMVKQDVGLTWDCTNGVIAWSCSEEIIGAMEAAGCVGLIIGMESGNEKVLHEIKKPGTVEIFKKAAKVFHKFPKINSRVFLMLGFPGESFSMVRDTFEVAKEMDLDWSMVTPLQPLPNTEIFEEKDAAPFEEIRFKLGAHGKQRKATEKKVNVFSTAFERAFDHPQGAIPTKEELNQLWAYMNYHLNFERLLTEHRWTKQVQMLKYLNYVADVVAPDDAFAQWYRSYLHQKVRGYYKGEHKDKLRKILEEEPAWRERFEEFRLETEDVKVS